LKAGGCLMVDCGGRDGWRLVVVLQEQNAKLQAKVESLQDR